MRELTDLEFGILKILADNKGHALWELVKLLGKEKSNLIITLNRLEDEIDLNDPFKIGYGDIINSTYLGTKFHEPNDNLSHYIRDQFEPETKRLLDLNSPDSYFYNIDELDKLLDDPNLFDEKRFEHIVLNEKIRGLINKKPNGQDLRHLNRLLLEEAYPEGIMKCQASIIYKGASRRTTNPESKQPRHHEIPYFLTNNLLVLRYILINTNLSIRKFYPRLSIKDERKLEKLREQIEWQQVSESEYHEIKDELEYKMYDDANWDIVEKKGTFLLDLLSSHYTLQFIEKYGFKLMIYKIHDWVKSWDKCWIIAEKSINRGIINNETDLECAERLIQFHLDVEEGFRRLEEKDEDDDEDI